ncbi:MAG: thioredoxin domain-containing protein [Mucilaginibacter polytrichastri]|nr:thioredoxin domain-containing protein [Mucilaginibacter polytrichastri]
MSYQNKLIDSTSPYLLQHAHNPVNWFPWGEEALQKAQAENKLILVSVGYSACHWCHVMERESFENEQIAQLMNDHFVCIKVDREERPDIDQIYMDAVQLMTGRGGWPMNCICLPDQRPVYGGTYFPPNDWANLLLNLAEFWKEKPAEATDYAEKLTLGIRSTELIKPGAKAGELNRERLEGIVSSWKRQFDYHRGGHNRAPKFPMPNNWHFLMRYAHFSGDEPVRVIVQLTLREMAFGGLYDQLGGGFARYSVDDRWHVPHFEKMLYDNAQLMSLYSEAYTWTQNPEYKYVVAETYRWLLREMRSPDGGFYSALDADSEGVEGKFYTWTSDEIREILKEDAAVFTRYFHVEDEGNWEEEQTNVLYRRDDEEQIAEEFQMDVEALRRKIGELKNTLLRKRDLRIRPGLDNKMITAWNGLMLRGLCDAYRAFGDKEYLQTAIGNAEFLQVKTASPDGGLVRIAGSAKSGFLDDYAFVADGYIALYEVTLQERWLERAQTLCRYAIDHFYDPESGVFFYTSAQDEQLIARKQELMDNVIPASNSQMARNLQALSGYYEMEEWRQIAKRQLSAVSGMIASYPAGYSNWLMFALEEISGRFEIVLAGEPEELRAGLEEKYVPNKLVLSAASSLPLASGKNSSEPKVYVCVNKTCALPVGSVGEALTQIESIVHQNTLK